MKSNNKSPNSFIQRRIRRIIMKTKVKEEISISFDPLCIKNCQTEGHHSCLRLRINDAVGVQKTSALMFFNNLQTTIPGTMDKQKRVCKKKTFGLLFELQFYFHSYRSFFFSFDVAARPRDPPEWDQVEIEVGHTSSMST